MISKRDIVYILGMSAVAGTVKYVLALEMQSFLIGILFGGSVIIGKPLWRRYSDRLYPNRVTGRVSSVYSQLKSRPTVMLSTDRGVDRIEAAAQAVPDSIWQSYSGVASGLICIWWGVWAGAGLYGLWHMLRTEPASTTTTSTTTASEGLTVSPAEVAIAVPEVVLEILMQLALAVPLYWAIMLVIVPSLLLHEFGHVVGFVRAGWDLDEYGVILWGPLPVAAFVRPRGRMEETSQDAYQRAVSSGPMAHVIFGSLYLAVGVGVDLATTSGAARVVVGAFVMLGLLEFLLGALNTLPVSGLDGQHFFKAWRSRDADWMPPRTDSHAAAEGFTRASGVIA